MIKDNTRMELTADDVEETVISEGKMEEDNMETAKATMEEVREENKRLKSTLSQMIKDYHSLQMQFNGALRKNQCKKLTNLSPMAAVDDESELVSLSLGRSSIDYCRREEKKTLENCQLQLGLNCKSYLGKSTEVPKKLNLRKSLDESEEGNDDVRSSDKAPKTSRSEDLQCYPSKKPRVSVKAVCNTQTMHDGCQWRKYGQKIAKGNPCPRAYYRCTISSSCPVRKQVQRCIDDMRILTTTYEGTHDHPLPPSATAMASTTSAAAAMLNCGAASSTTPSRFGFSFPSSNNLINIASSQSHPTVILDLTAPNHNTNKFSSTLFSATHSSPTSLNFSSYSDFNETLQKASPYSQSLIHRETVIDEEIAEATKAITRDPTFRTALAAAITSFVGTDINGNGRNSGVNFNLNFSQGNGSLGFPQSLSFKNNLLSISKPQTVPLAAHEGEERRLS